MHYWPINPAGVATLSHPSAMPTATLSLEKTVTAPTGVAAATKPIIIKAKNPTNRIRRIMFMLILLFTFSTREPPTPFRSHND